MKKSVVPVGPSVYTKPAGVALGTRPKESAENTVVVLSLEGPADLAQDVILSQVGRRKQNDIG